jgi:uncharacterized membrane protein
MPTPPLHPAIVHLPIGLAAVVPLVALVLTVALWRGRWPAGVWSIVVALQLLTFVGGGMAMRTGEREEEHVERFVPHDALEEHEERAEAFVWTAGAVFLLGLGVLFASRKPALARALTVATTAGSLAVAGLAMRAGKAGGELVYVHGAAAAYGAPAGAPAQGGGTPVAGDHDD